MPQESRRALAAVEASEPVLTAADLAFWEEHGYVVLHDAIPPATREAAAQALWQHLGASPDDPETWYRRSDHGIMVQYFQHPAFTPFAARRASTRLSRSYGARPICGRPPTASASIRPSATVLCFRGRICIGMSA